MVYTFLNTFYILYTHFYVFCIYVYIYCFALKKNLVRLRPTLCAQGLGIIVRNLVRHPCAEPCATIYFCRFVVRCFSSSLPLVLSSSLPLFLSSFLPFFLSSLFPFFLFSTLPFKSFLSFFFSCPGWLKL